MFLIINTFIPKFSVVSKKKKRLNLQSDSTLIYKYIQKFCVVSEKRLNLQSDSTLIINAHPKIQCCEWKRLDLQSDSALISVVYCTERSLHRKNYVPQYWLKSIFICNIQFAVLTAHETGRHCSPSLECFDQELLIISSTATDPYFPHSNWFPIFTGIDFLFIALQPFNDWCQLSHTRIAQTDNQYLWIFFTHHTKQTERTFLTLPQCKATVFMFSVYNNA